MNPEQRIAQLEALVSELMDWKKARTLQQITDPLDSRSLNAIKSLTARGVGASSTTPITITATPQTIHVPTASSTLVVQTPLGIKSLLVQ